MIMRQWIHTSSTVNTDGFGISAIPVKLGSPGAAIKFTFGSVMLKPFMPLSARLISSGPRIREQRTIYL